MPEQSFNELFAQEPADPETRVLWIGHDDSLSVGGSSFGDGLTLAVSPARVVGFPDRWAGAPQPGDGLVADAVELAIDGGTSRLGRLLAPFAVGEIIVLGQSAPAPATGLEHPVPDTLIAALEEQLDLAQIEVSPGLVRYRNDAAFGIASVVPEGTTAEIDLRTFAGGRDTVDGTSLLPVDERASVFSGAVTVDDEVYLAVPADTDWVLEVDGREGSRVSALGWASAFDPPLSGTAEVRHVTGFGHRALMGGQAVLWVLAVLSVMRLSARARELRP